MLKQNQKMQARKNQVSKSINKVTLLGYVGSDPEFKETVANFSLGTDYHIKNKITGEIEKRTEWHRCCAFGKLVDIFAQYVNKGSRILIEGHLKTSKYLRDNQDHVSTNIIVKDVVFLSDNKNSQKKDRLQEALNYKDEMISGYRQNENIDEEDYNY